jgi:ABC-type nitrate/sulfonate/bicarbonate transport system permease component
MFVLGTIFGLILGVILGFALGWEVFEEASLEYYYEDDKE